MDNCFLIVGLGNPGEEYNTTRHNAGFLMTDRLVERWGASAQWGMSAPFRSRIAKTRPEGASVVVCQPQTYMNLSGEAVGQVVRYFRFPLSQVAVVVDDADLPLGEIRMRPRGGSGGHHGLESIERHLGSGDFVRQRIGIGRPRTSGQRQISRHVLGRFNGDEWKMMDQVLSRAIDQIECWLTCGALIAMNKFNGPVGRSET